MRNVLAPALLLTCLMGAVPADAASVQQQQFDGAVRLRSNPAQGEKLFAACATCHGGDGAGSVANGVPSLAGQHARVVMGQLLKFRTGVRWDIRMEAVAEAHMLDSPQALADVAGFVASLPARPTQAFGSGERLQHGATLYQPCISCHGRSGEGANARDVPRLAGQHYSYLLRRLRDLAEPARPDAGTGHPPLLKGFAPADFVDVADYLARGAR